MENTDKIRMHISIAGERIPLTVDFDRQDEVREAERQVGDLFERWRRKFPTKNSKELLAMIAYQYASYYLSLKERYERASDAVGELEGKVRKMLVRDA